MEKHAVLLLDGFCYCRFLKKGSVVTKGMAIRMSPMLIFEAITTEKSFHENYCIMAKTLLRFFEACTAEC